MNLALVWCAAFIIFLIAEGITFGLRAVWFAVGSLFALLFALLGAGFWPQCAVFFAVSIAALFLTRPLVRKYVDPRKQATNADRVIGQTCAVTKTIDNLNSEGEVFVDGKYWSARSESYDGDAPIIVAGETVTALRIEGVKLIVAKEHSPSRETVSAN